MAKYIYDKLSMHNNKNMTSFHTPGHKSQPVNSYYSKFFDNIAKFDLTELPDTDNLLIPQSAILHSEKHAAHIFQANRSLFSTFGCTLCIQMMIKAVAAKKKKIISDRNIHKSAVNAMALLDIEPIWVYPNEYAGETVSGRINISEIENTIKKNPEVGAVYITSPNYYGVLHNIDKIADICHQYEIPLLIDNAHGSHLYFIDESFKKAFCKADMIACSLHKTLPVMTGGAILNINNGDYIKQAEDAMALFSGTSPSYPIMTSIDLCMDYLESNKNAFEHILHRIRKIQDIAENKGFSAVNGKLRDPMRIVLGMGKLKISGFDLAREMRKNRIEPEFSDACNVVLIPTLANSENDFRRLEDFLYQFDSSRFNHIEEYNFSQIKFPEAEMVLSLRQALFSRSEIINIEDALDRIAFDSICNYPPGIPFAVPGEKIGSKAIEICIAQGIKKIRVVVKQGILYE